MSEDGATNSRPLAVRLLALAIWVAAFLAHASAFRDQPQWALAFLCLVPAQFLVALVHECGHALAALACGWRVVLFVVRPIGIQIPNRNLAIVRSGYRQEAGGWVVSVPRSPEAGTEQSWSIIVAAGPIASFLLAAFAILGWASFLRPLDSDAVAISWIGLGLGLQSFYSGLFSLLPAGTPGRWSDGDQLRALERAEGCFASRPVAWVEALLGSNVRLRAIPDWLVAEARTLSGSSQDIARYVDTLDIGRTLDGASVDVALARSQIEAFRARYGTDGWLAACDAYLAAIWEGDAERAKAALAEPGISPGVPQMSLAAEAAVAARTGESALAHAKLREMRRAVKLASPFRDPTFRDIRRQIERLLV